MRKLSLISYCVIVAAYIWLGQVQNQSLQFYLKPLIIPALAAYFIVATTNKNRIFNLILVALFFSWAGDVLLMFEKKNSLFFIFGLSAFFIAHLFFIFAFGKICSPEKLSLKIPILIISILVYNVLIAILFPHLGALLIPVCLYGFIICMMLSFALHLLYIPNFVAGRLIAAGASFFVLSDACLALNKFYHPFSFASVVIMITYALAQLLIIKGIKAYNNSGVATSSQLHIK